MTKGSTDYLTHIRAHLCCFLYIDRSTNQAVFAQLRTGAEQVTFTCLGMECCAYHVCCSAEHCTHILDLTSTYSCATHKMYSHLTYVQACQMGPKSPVLLDGLLCISPRHAQEGLSAYNHTNIEASGSCRKLKSQRTVSRSEPLPSLPPAMLWLFLIFTHT